MKKEVTFVLAAAAWCVLNTPVVAMASPTPDTDNKFTINSYVTFLALPDIYYNDVGAIYALNHDLSKDGWLVRPQFYGGYYDYEYKSTGVTRTHGVSYYGGLVMGGYQWHFNEDAVVSIYGGLEAQQNNDDLAGVKIAGSQAGVSGIAEVFLPFDQFFGYGKAYLSSVWGTYSYTGKIGYKINPNLSVGTEIGAIGNVSLKTRRAGGFVFYNILDDVQLFGSLGYNFDLNPVKPNDYSGVYGMLYIGMFY